MFIDKAYTVLLAGQILTLKIISFNQDKYRVWRVQEKHWAGEEET